MSNINHGGPNQMAVPQNLCLLRKSLVVECKSPLLPTIKLFKILLLNKLSFVNVKYLEKLQVSKHVQLSICLHLIQSISKLLLLTFSKTFFAWLVRSVLVKWSVGLHWSFPATWTKLIQLVPSCCTDDLIRPPIFNTMQNTQKHTWMSGCFIFYYNGKYMA